MRTNDRSRYFCTPRDNKLPRKAKLRECGRRMRRKHLRSLLASTKVLERAHGIVDTQVSPFYFCPQCGCQSVRWVNHHVEYPCRWEEGFCSRCGLMVWFSDNSPFRHVLEIWPERWEL